MKKVINGKMYNTETAKKILEYKNGKSSSDLEFKMITIYQKKTGEFFQIKQTNSEKIFTPLESKDQINCKNYFKNKKRKK